MSVFEAAARLLVKENRVQAVTNQLAEAALAVAAPGVEVRVTCSRLEDYLMAVKTLHDVLDHVIDHEKTQQLAREQFSRIGHRDPICIEFTNGSCILIRYVE